MAKRPTEDEMARALKASGMGWDSERGEWITPKDAVAKRAYGGLGEEGLRRRGELKDRTKAGATPGESTRFTDKRIKVRDAKMAAISKFAKSKKMSK